VKTVELTPKRGFVAGAQVVRPENEMFLIASDGQVIRIRCGEVSRQGRATTGVRVMRLDPDQQLVAMAGVTEEGDET
jgi:DNA gyrase subunit A